MREQLPQALSPGKNPAHILSPSATCGCPPLLSRLSDSGREERIYFIQHSLPTLPLAFSRPQMTSLFCLSGFLHPCGSRSSLFPLGSVRHQTKLSILFCLHCGPSGGVHRSLKCAGQSSSGADSGVLFCQMKLESGVPASEKPWGLLPTLVNTAQGLWAG